MSRVPVGSRRRNGSTFSYSMWAATDDGGARCVGAQRRDREPGAVDADEDAAGGRDWSCTGRRTRRSWPRATRARRGRPCISATAATIDGVGGPAGEDDFRALLRARRRWARGPSGRRCARRTGRCPESGGRWAAGSERVRADGRDHGPGVQLAEDLGHPDDSRSSAAMRVTMPATQLTPGVGARGAAGADDQRDPALLRPRRADPQVAPDGGGGRLGGAGAEVVGPESVEPPSTAMTSAPRAMPRVTDSALKPAPSMPLAKMIPTPGRNGLVGHGRTSLQG